LLRQRLVTFGGKLLHPLLRIGKLALQIGDQGLHNHSVAPTSIADRVLFSGLIGIEGFGVNAYDTESGELLVQFPMQGSVNSAPTPLGSSLFVAAGTSVDGSGSGVFAFSLP
jgi:hypothetical protein